MAWRCSGLTNEALIENLANASILKNPRVISAMKKVDRKDFCPRDPYEDSPQTIGYAATISAPHMHGYALDQLEPFLQPGMKALDIGSGSGYLCACMAEMVGPTGKVIGIEHIPELVTSSTRNLNKNYRDQMESKQIEIIEGDGREGYEKEAPYDCIHVGAAAPTTPEALIQQLKSPGRLFVPVGTDSQHIVLYDKDEHGNVSEKKWLGVMYIPLTDAKKQRRSIYE